MLDEILIILNQDEYDMDTIENIKNVLTRYGLIAYKNGEYRKGKKNVTARK